MSSGLDGSNPRTDIWVAAISSTSPGLAEHADCPREAWKADRSVDGPQPRPTRAPADSDCCLSVRASPHPLHHRLTEIPTSASRIAAISTSSAHSAGDSSGGVGRAKGNLCPWTSAGGTEAGRPPTMRTRTPGWVSIALHSSGYARPGNCSFSNAFRRSAGRGVDHLGDGCGLVRRIQDDRGRIPRLPKLRRGMQRPQVVADECTGLRLSTSRTKPARTLGYTSV